MKKIIEFLLKNGYKDVSEEDSEYRSFCKEGLSGIDVSEGEIVFVGESGDWLHIPLNYYALIGSLIHHRQLTWNYKD